MWPDAGYNRNGYHSGFGTILSQFYSQLKSTSFEIGAQTILDWLELGSEEVETSIFWEIVFPFLKSLPSTLQEYGLDFSSSHSAFCRQVLVQCLRRCVGDEPTKSPDWTRPAAGCDSKDCLACPTINDFLQDPAKEIACLEYTEPEYGKDHLHKQASHYLHGHECEPNYENETSVKRLRIKKADPEWEKAHREWEIRCHIVEPRYREAVEAAKPLLGKEYDDMLNMAAIKTPV